MSGVLLPSVQRFIEDRKFLRNCSERTISWYEQALARFTGCVTLDDYRARIVELRQGGISAVSCNSWISGVNAYLHWSNAGFKLSKLQTEQLIVTTFSAAQISRLLEYHARSKALKRAQVLAALILDTGVRIAESVSLRRDAVDLDNLLVRVFGKGRKERIVPLTIEGRRRLYLWLRSQTGPYIFPALRGPNHISIRNAQRDLSKLCERAGITGLRHRGPHVLRHTFATSYLKNGGNLEYLRRILGHHSIVVTQRYLQSIQPEDLQSSHISPLSPKGGR